MIDSYLFDSSIWIEMERKNSAILKRAVPLIQKNRVVLADVIVAEVLRGCKNESDFKKLYSAFSDFTILTAPWMQVADLAFRLRLKGHTPPLIDCYIALCASKHRTLLVTQDKHFLAMQDSIKLKLEYW
jgi:predicted nucleic acid-binding protein